MKKVEVINAIESIITGLEQLKVALDVNEEPIVEDDKEVESNVIPFVAPTVSEEEVEESVDEETLKAMKYNEFKKYAAKLGVKCTGTREEIMQRILNLSKEESNAEPVVEESVVAEESVEEDEFILQARSVLSETDVEDVIDALADVGIKANKKNAEDKLADALRKGLIELEDDEEDEDDEEEVLEEVEDSDEEEIEEEEFEVSTSDYYEDFDLEGVNNPGDMSEERLSASTEYMEELIESLEEMSMDDMLNVLGDIASDEELELLGDEPDEVSVFKLYAEIGKRFIDNDGESHEPSEPYEVGDKLMCCAHELKYVEKTGKYICEICGEEYEEE